MSGTTDTGAGAMPAAAVDAPVTSESVKLTGTSEGAPDNAALVGEKKDPFGYVLKTPPRLLRKVRITVACAWKSITPLEPRVRLCTGWI
jgi:hypothetical protein